MYTKKLTTTAYLKLFLFAQLHSREDLRHIVDDILCEELQRELGLTSILPHSSAASINKWIPKYSH
uniref:DUF4372 domain-containing protein n=1 Tax=Paenibacillus sp. FSL H8-0537 TaxID=2921399 RepID=UPI0040546C6D